MAITARKVKAAAARRRNPFKRLRDDSRSTPKKDYGIKFRIRNKPLPGQWMLEMGIYVSGSASASNKTPLTVIKLRIRNKPLQRQRMLEVVKTPLPSPSPEAMSTPSSSSTNIKEPAPAADDEAGPKQPKLTFKVRSVKPKHPCFLLTPRDKQLLGLFDLDDTGRFKNTIMPPGIPVY